MMIMVMMMVREEGAKAKQKLASCVNNYLLNGDQNVDAGEHNHGQQTIAEDGGHRTKGHLRAGDHQREQAVEEYAAHDADAVDVREGHFSTLQIKHKERERKSA